MRAQSLCTVGIQLPLLCAARLVHVMTDPAITCGWKEMRAVPRIVTVRMRSSKVALDMGFYGYLEFFKTNSNTTFVP